MREGKKLIAIADDEKEIRDVVSLLLTGEGYAVQTAEDGQCVVDQCSPDVDLYILDVNMPRLSGIMAAAEIRKRYDTPIIFLTAYSSESDKVMGFSVGADDYIVKPFSMMEMVSRVKAVLRRSQPQQVSKLLKVGGLVVNLDEHTVIVDGNRVQLTYKEFELLRMFLSHPGMVYTREQLFSQVWKLDYMGDSRTLDSHIRTLRQKLEGYGKLIETVRNVGYRWEVGYDK